MSGADQREERKKERPDTGPARRFIRAYNVTDAFLRKKYGIELHIGFSEAVRRCAKLSPAVAAVSAKLQDYARLRNAIVHGGDREEIIAEPHLDVVEDFEHIAELLQRPPLCMETVAKRPLCLDVGATLKEAVMKIERTGFSNFPVTEQGKLVGMIYPKLIVEGLAVALARGVEAEAFLSRPVEELCRRDMGRSFAVCDTGTDVTAVLELFERNKKLLAVVLTRDGKIGQRPEGIVTVADTLEINNMLEAYL